MSKGFRVLSKCVMCFLTPVVTLGCQVQFGLQKRCRYCFLVSTFILTFRLAFFVNQVLASETT